MTLELSIIDGERIVQTLTEAGQAMNTGTAEMVLDFAAVKRLDPVALRAMESLTRTSEEKKLSVTLRNVNVEIYKVLKLARLSEHFRFEN